MRMILYCFRCALKPSATKTARFEAISTFRNCGIPYGLHVSLSTLHPFCSREFHPLRHRRKTRYGWLVRPYPTGTLTLQDAPSFAWRTNARAQRRALARPAPKARIDATGYWCDRRARTTACCEAVAEPKLERRCEQSA